MSLAAEGVSQLSRQRGLQCELRSGRLCIGLPQLLLDAIMLPLTSTLSSPTRGYVGDKDQNACRNKELEGDVVLVWRESKRRPEVSFADVPPDISWQ